MKKRYIYSLLFGIPGVLLALIISFFIFGAASGFLWIFVFGDNPWPQTINDIFPILFITLFLALWIAFITAGFLTGKKLEGYPDLNKSHILISAGAIIVPIIFIILHQFGVGNIGAKSDSILCAEFCNEKGYSTSSLPPKNSGERNCSCLDDSGQDVLAIPLRYLASE